MSSADRISLVNLFLQLTTLFTPSFFNLIALCCSQAKDLPGSLSPKAVVLVESLEGKVSVMPFFIAFTENLDLIGHYDTCS